MMLLLGEDCTITAEPLVCLERTADNEYCNDRLVGSVEI